jgi:hypothetical protein
MIHLESFCSGNLPHFHLELLKSNQYIMRCEQHGEKKFLCSAQLNGAEITKLAGQTLSQIFSLDVGIHLHYALFPFHKNCLT